MAGISSKAATNIPANKFKYKGKELNSNEFNDGSGLDWMDYGARIYDGQIGRWHVVDPKADLYARYSPYVYSINDPINYYDTDGEIVRDKNGNIVFIPTEEGVFRHLADKEGAKGTYGYIFANDGTAIRVFKNKSNKKGFDTDCHGQTFTKGKYWISNPEVRAILKGDGYKKVKKSDIKKGDIVIYADGEGKVEDSRTVVTINPTTGEITVYGQGGLEEENHEDGIDEAWNSETQEYYRKTQKDKVVDDNVLAAIKKQFQKIIDDIKKKETENKKKTEDKKKGGEKKKKEEDKKKTTVT